MSFPLNNYEAAMWELPRLSQGPASAINLQASLQTDFQDSGGFSPPSFCSFSCSPRKPTLLGGRNGPGKRYPQPANYTDKGVLSHLPLGIFVPVLVVHN